MVALEALLTILKMGTNKTSLSKGLRNLAIALPLLFGAPIVITIGFKALSKDGVYWILIIGILLALLAIFATALGIKHLMNSLFEKEE